VEQDAPGERGRTARLQLLDHHQRVNPDVAFGMKLRRLFDAFHARNFRQGFRGAVGFVEKLETAASEAFCEDLVSSSRMRSAETWKISGASLVIAINVPLSIA